MMKKIHCHSMALIVSYRCTLKCKLCLVYAPYYKNPKDYPVDLLVESIDECFRLVDSCDTFNVQGGEPLMYKDLPSIMDKLGEYKKQIGKLLLTTNGTLLPDTKLINSLIALGDFVQVNISNYGIEKSPKVSDLISILEKNNVAYRVINYDTGNIHYGGWIDFTDHTLKYSSEEELLGNAAECGYRKGGNLAIVNGGMYICCRVVRRIDLGIIEKNDESFIDLFDTRELGERREIVRKILNAKYTPACKYCMGKRSDIPHYPPAEQLTKEELENGIEKIPLINDER